MAKLPNSSGPARRSGSTHPRSMERRSSFAQWNVLQDAQSEALYARGNFAADFYFGVSAEERVLRGAIRRWLNHGRRRDSGNIPGDFKKFRFRRDGGGQRPRSNAEDDRNCRRFYRHWGADGKT